MKEVNNDYYNHLNERWYLADDHPIALLRAENRLRAPWVAAEITHRLGIGAKTLDIGCGGGFLSNELALCDFEVTGVDLSEPSLKTARHYDTTHKVHYINASAFKLPFDFSSFDVVCAMDVLEHVDMPQELIREASRVLKPGGLFFFHTFNRNLLSYLMVIKGVDWLFKSPPKNIHVYGRFIKPAELKQMCQSLGLEVEVLSGLVPKLWNRSFWKLLFQGKVAKDFQFVHSKRLTTGYCGLATKARE